MVPLGLVVFQQLHPTKKPDQAWQSLCLAEKAQGYPRVFGDMHLDSGESRTWYYETALLGMMQPNQSWYLQAIPLSMFHSVQQNEEHLSKR